MSTEPQATTQANEKLVNNESVQNASNALSPGFNTNLFGCFEDIVGCLLACCVSCVPMVANKANVDERGVQWTDFVCCPNPYQTRQSLRMKYGKLKRYICVYIDTRTRTHTHTIAHTHTHTYICIYIDRLFYQVKRILKSNYKSNI